MKLRYRLLLLGVVVIAASVMVVALTGPSSSASFTASDVSTTTHDGEIDVVTIAPQGAFSWTGLEEEPESATVTVQVQTEDGWTTVTSKTYENVKGLTGSQQYSLKPVDVTEDALSEDDFAATDGQSTSMTVTVRVVVSVDAQETRTTTASDSFTVTVANKAADADASGRADAGVSSSSEVDG